MTTNATEHGKRTPWQIREAVTRLAVEGWAPKQIHEYLKEQERLKPLLPNLRTVQRIVRDVSARRSAPTVSPIVTSDQAARVLDTLAVVIQRTEGHITAFTQHQVEWIGRIFRARPDVSPWAAYLLALDYQQRQEAGKSTSDLDAYLAFAPWTQEGDDLYFSQFARGRVQPAAVYYEVDAKKAQQEREWMEERRRLEEQEQRRVDEILEEAERRQVEEWKKGAGHGQEG